MECNEGARGIRIRFGGIVYYIYEKAPPFPQIVEVAIKAAILGGLRVLDLEFWASDDIGSRSTKHSSAQVSGWARGGGIPVVRDRTI